VIESHGEVIGGGVWTSLEFSSGGIGKKRKGSEKNWELGLSSLSYSDLQRCRIRKT